MTREERAMELFREGKNCAQAVLLAFADKTGLDDTTALGVTAGLGGGVGRLHEICGAVSGAVVALGMIKGDPASREEKGAMYAQVQRVAQKVEQEFGSYRCGPILGMEGAGDPMPQPRTPDYFETRPCMRCVGCAARILEEILAEPLS